MRPQGLFAGQRLTMPDAVELTVQSLQGYGPQHDHWAIAWSGGKDSTATLTLLIHLIETGRLAAPQSLTVYYADTRQELPPLYASSLAILEALKRRGNWIRTEIVRAPMDKRFLVYILGRGVPPPNNNTLRWCTRQIKVEPMQQAVCPCCRGSGEVDADFSSWGITGRQAQLLAFLRDYGQRHAGASPSYGEMRDALGLASKSGVHRLVTALEQRGRVVRMAGVQRSIRVLGPAGAP